MVLYREFWEELKFSTELNGIKFASMILLRTTQKHFADLSILQ
jgi:hypothetical protein